MINSNLVTKKNITIIHLLSLFISVLLIATGTLCQCCKFFLLLLFNGIVNCLKYLCSDIQI
jgi:hypothetical protein